MDAAATPESLAAMVQQLSQDFNVPAPGLSCNPRRKISCYKPKSQRIELEKNICSNPRVFSTVIHEFAHHLDFVRQPVGSRRGRRHHDRTFVWTLVEVIDSVYSSRDEYFWHMEYKSIRNMHPRYARMSKQKFDNRVKAAVVYALGKETAA